MRGERVALADKVGSKVFSLAVVFVLFAELLAPYAFAAPTPSATPSATPFASPTPKPVSNIAYPSDFSSGGGSCTVNSMTDAERKALWDNTNGRPIEELTDLPVQSALNSQNTPVFNPFAPNAPLNPQQQGAGFSPLEQQISLSTLSAMTGMTKDELVKGYVRDFNPDKDSVQNVSDNTYVTLAQAQAIATKKGGTAADRVNQIISQVLGAKNGNQNQIPQIPTPTPGPYAGLKVILPGNVGADGKQREITYSQIAAGTALDANSCLVKGTIKGRVSYLGVLESDLTYGIPGNQTFSGQYIYPPTGLPDEDLVDPRSNQWFVASSITSVLSLNGGANIALPSFYEDWIAFTGKWSRFDMYASLGLSLGATSITNYIKQRRQFNQELKTGLESARQQSKGFQDKALTDLYGPIEERAGGKVFTNTNNEELIVRTVHVRDEAVLDAAGHPVLDAAGNPVTAPVQAIVATDHRGAEVIREEITGGKTVDGVLNSHNLQPKRISSEGLEAQVKDSFKTAGAWERLKRQTVPRVSYNLMMGAAWMGPARFAYDIADRNFFEATGFNQNKYLKVLVDKPVAQKFHDATNIFGIGKIEELVSDWTGGAPAKAFSSGPVFLANYPSGEAQSQASTTAISSADSWQINSVWTGPSFAVNFEDVRTSSQNQQYTSLPVVANEILPKPIINTKTSSQAYNYLLTLAVPFLVARKLVPEVGQTLGLAGTLLVTEQILEVDPNFGKGLDCTKDQQDNLKDQYRRAILADYAVTLATTFLPLIQTVNVFWKQILVGSRIAGDVNAWVNPLLAWQWYIGNQAQIYAANCKDSQYKVLTYQKIPNPDVNKTNAQPSGGSGQPVQQVQNAAQNFVSSFNGKGNTVESELAKYTEILNLKTRMTDQQGFVQPKDILMMHIDKSAWMVHGGLFDTLNKSGCVQNECDPTSDGGSICITPDGIKKYNKDGSVAFDFNGFYWKLRSASILRSQELARMILPNTIITTQLECGEKPFISIDSAGSSSIADATCPAADCLKKQIKLLLSDFDGKDLTKAIGKVASVETSLGMASFTGNSISFTRLSIGEAGVEERAPTLDQVARNSGLGSTGAGARLEVLGNGNTTLLGGNTISLGTLKTIIGDKGKIEYDPVAKRLYLFIYVLADGKAQTIADIVGRTSTVNANGKTIPVINFDLKGKTGFEDLTKQLQDALNKIQQDSTGGKGGFQVFETPNGTYYIRDDGTIQYVDKKTGQAQTFKLTGSPYTDANGNIVFPTDKGNISFNPGINDQGQPVINVNGAGIKDAGTLDAAKGPGGIFTFNPSTGAITVYNGQDLPMDPRFASQGLGFVGTPGGTVGMPADNPFVLPPVTDQGLSRNSQNSLLLPSWPTELPLFAVMLAAVLMGVLFVRTRRFGH